jgi:hypothetical protein
MAESVLVMLPEEQDTDSGEIIEERITAPGKATFK